MAWIEPVTLERPEGWKDSTKWYLPDPPVDSKEPEAILHFDRVKVPVKGCGLLGWVTLSKKASAVWRELVRRGLHVRMGFDRQSEEAVTEYFCQIRLRPMSITIGYAWALDPEAAVLAAVEDCRWKVVTGGGLV